jgi:hypothetical protein
MDGPLADAGPTPGKAGKEALVGNNRYALPCLLRDKIDTIHAPSLPGCRQGESVRMAKRRACLRYESIPGTTSGWAPDIQGDAFMHAGGTGESKRYSPHGKTGMRCSVQRPRSCIGKGWIFCGSMVIRR